MDAKKEPPWLLLDVSNMCWRAYHSTGQLRNDNAATGVLYGFFRDLILLQEQWKTNRVIFAFDWGKPNRCEFFPDYKKKDKERTPEEIAIRKEVSSQINALRRQHLDFLGYANLFAFDGYEADDVIASVCLDPKLRSQEKVIVSSDQDLYQMLGRHVSIYNPGKKEVIDAHSFAQKYGILPSHWTEVKAIAGCKSDNIPGVKGVAEKTAIKYLRDELKTKTKAFQSIVEFRRNGDYPRNLKLVSLPAFGKILTKETNYVKWMREPVKETRMRWKGLLRELGMSSLVQQYGAIMGKEYS